MTAALPWIMTPFSCDQSSEYRSTVTATVGFARRLRTLRAFFSDAKYSLPSASTWQTGTWCGVRRAPTVATRQTRCHSTSWATDFLRRMMSPPGTESTRQHPVDHPASAGSIEQTSGARVAVLAPSAKATLAWPMQHHPVAAPPPGGKNDGPANAEMECQGEDGLHAPSEGPLHQGRRDDRAHDGAAIRQPQGTRVGRPHDPVLHQSRWAQPLRDTAEGAREGEAPPAGAGKDPEDGGQTAHRQAEHAGARSPAPVSRVGRRTHACCSVAVASYPGGALLLLAAFVSWLVLVQPVNRIVADAIASAPGSVPDVWAQHRALGVRSSRGLRVPAPRALCAAGGRRQADAADRRHDARSGTLSPCAVTQPGGCISRTHVE